MPLRVQLALALWLGIVGGLASWVVDETALRNPRSRICPD